MAFEIDSETGDLTLIQGDSGTLVISGLPKSTDYSVYFAMQDEKRNGIGNEVEIGATGSSTLKLFVPASVTDNLTVKTKENTATYYYGLKICYTSGEEETLFINDNDITGINKVIVYPKKVEGLL